MANRYWVGGTGTWNDASTTNWSNTSGGSSGASVPLTDDVFFDGNSGGGTVTISSSAYNPLIKSLNTTGFTGTITGGSSSLNIFGSFTLGSGTTYSPTPTTFQTSVRPSSSGTFNVNTNGVTVGRDLVLQADNASAIISIQNAITTSRALFFIGNGTINTNNYALNCVTELGTGGGYTGTYNFGSSLVTIGTSPFCTLRFKSGGTVNASNADFVIGATLEESIYLNSNTIKSLTITNRVKTVFYTGGTITALTATNTLNANYEFQLRANLTVTNLLTLTKSGTGSFTVNSNTIGTPITLSAGSTSLSNISWRDITAAGAGSPFTGVGFIDLGGNTNIVFPITANGLFFGSNF